MMAGDTITPAGARAPGVGQGSGLRGGVQPSHLPDTERDSRVGHGGHERKKQTAPGNGYAGSRLNQSIARAGIVENASLEAVLGKTRRTEF
jgi:hypothetical protein